MRSDRMDLLRPKRPLSRPSIMTKTDPKNLKINVKINPNQDLESALKR